MKMRRRLQVAVLSALVSFSGTTHAIDTATITASAIAPDCAEYRIVGICYWLYCSWSGCKIRTSVKVSHYIPDAVVSGYSNTGENPWTKMALLSPPLPGAQTGGQGVNRQSNENEMPHFKNADVIGHPGSAIFNDFVSQFGYTCSGAGTALMPYFLSTLDTVSWRYNLPEMVYPEALIPGMRDIGSFVSGNTWGSVYPRGGFTHQTDDYKAAAIIAQRAGDIVTREGQPHVYQPLLASGGDGYWPAGELLEGDASTGKWQELVPQISQQCQVFPNESRSLPQATDGGYVWALWRPYSCCQKRGQTFLGSMSF